MAAKSNGTFFISHKVINGAHHLEFTPAIKNEGFPPKLMEITEGQWNDLRYHFGIAIIGKDHEQLIYIV